MLEQWLPIIYIFTGLLGLVIGSFLNVVIYRVPRKESLSFPASHCPGCNNPIKWYDNIPVISYMLLKGKCRSCKEKISPRYSIVELLNMLLWLACVFFLIQNSTTFLGEGITMENAVGYALVAMAFCSTLLVVFFIDLEHTYIPDRFHVIVLALAVIAICLNAFVPSLNDGIKFADRLIGGFGGGTLFLIIYFGSYLILKREAMGFADVKLVAVAGLLLGWQNTTLSIFLAAVSACVVLAVPHFMGKKDRFKEYPFAPYLTGGMIASMFIGKALITWYLSLMP
ncbi:MAG: prepilin peptidase [Clostridiales bacterium]|jgi:leader peptidase (prepilin peptidase)/N-methyltransferase|nr:prepilin peptidase [Clostridiales bacterium]